MSTIVFPLQSSDCSRDILSEAASNMSMVVILIATPKSFIFDIADVISASILIKTPSQTGKWGELAEA